MCVVGDSGGRTIHDRTALALFFNWQSFTRGNATVGRASERASERAGERSEHAKNERASREERRGEEEEEEERRNGEPIARGTRSR